MRVSEALTLLPVLSPDAIVGVTLGCALTNALGSSMGLIDVVVGTSATLIAALMSWALRKARVFGLPVASSLPPVLVNAVFIGAEITLLSRRGGTRASSWPPRCRSAPASCSPAACSGCFSSGRWNARGWGNGCSENLKGQKKGLRLCRRPFPGNSI